MSDSLIGRQLRMRQCAVAACRQWWATTAPTTWFSGRICPGCIAGTAQRQNPEAAA